MLSAGTEIGQTSVRTINLQTMVECERDEEQAEQLRGVNGAADTPTAVTQSGHPAALRTSVLTTDFNGKRGRVRCSAAASDSTSALKAPVGLSVVLLPLDFLSAMPVEFRDEHNEAPSQTVEAPRLAQAAEQRVSGMERRLEEEGPFYRVADTRRRPEPRRRRPLTKEAPRIHPLEPGLLSCRRSHLEMAKPSRVRESSALSRDFEITKGRAA